MPWFMYMYFPRYSAITARLFLNASLRWSKISARHSCRISSKVMHHASEICVTRLFACALFVNVFLPLMRLLLTDAIVLQELCFSWRCREHGASCDEDVSASSSCACECGRCWFAAGASRVDGNASLSWSAHETKRVKCGTATKRYCCSAFNASFELLVTLPPIVVGRVQISASFKT